MYKNYKIHFVSDEEFLSLPGKDMDTKVGVAYPKYGEAFVRKSGSNVVDVFSAMHELEHLEGNDLHEHYDEENQCYYKDFGNFLGPIGTVLGSILGGPAGGMIGGGIGQTGSALFGQNQKSPQPQMPQINFSSGSNQQMPQTGMPNVIQSGGGGAAGIGGSAGSPGAKGASMNDILGSQAGFYSGRNPMNMFNENAAGTPMGGAA